MLAQAVAAVALGVLGLAGTAKLVDPDPTSGALGAAGFPSGRTVTRTLGIIEISATIAGLTVGGIVTVIPAVLYLAFAWFTLSGVLNRRPIQSCGCFGREDTPPSWLHVTYNSVAAVMLGWVALTDAQPIIWSAPLVELMVYIAFAGLGTYASYLLLSVMPRTLAASSTP